MKNFKLVSTVSILILGLITLTQSCSPYSAQKSATTLNSIKGDPNTLDVPTDKRSMEDNPTTGGGTVTGNPKPTTSIYISVEEAQTKKLPLLSLCVAETYFSEPKIIEDETLFDLKDFLKDLFDQLEETIRSSFDWAHQTKVGENLEIDKPKNDVVDTEFTESHIYRQAILRLSKNCNGENAPSVTVENSHGTFKSFGETLLTFNHRDMESEVLNPKIEDVELVLDSIYPELEDVKSDKDLIEVVLKFRGTWFVPQQ